MHFTVRRACRLCGGGGAGRIRGVKVVNFNDVYLVLELTNQCPLACTHCIQGFRDDYDHLKTAGHMDPALVHGLLDDLKARGARFNDLILFWLGEPLLHPEFPAIYRAVLAAARTAKLFNTVTVHTNAVKLTGEIAALAAAHCDVRQQWHFSIDAATRGTYRAIKGRDLFDEVAANVEAMVAVRAAARARYPRLVFQFIVRDVNRCEAGAFADRWRGVTASHGAACGVAGPHVPGGDGDYVFYRQLDCLDAPAQDGANTIYREVLRGAGLPVADPGGADESPGSSARLTACSGFFKSPTINWDGRVTVCTRDSGLRLQIGDLSKDPFTKIWFDNPRLDAIRRSVASGDYTGLDFCRGCIIPRSHNYTGITAAEIDESLGR